MMKEVKVININQDTIQFENGMSLYSDHRQDCCESHYMDMGDLDLDDFNGLLFNLSDDNFFNRIDGYGIELLPINGFPIRIPCYGSNNGYYSSNLSLVLSNNGKSKYFDISECQDICWD